MNITIIHGQKHKGNTWMLTQLFLDQLQDINTNITEFFLPDKQIGYCTGCLNCIKRDEKTCPHAGGVQPIVAALDNADLIIFTSPCYVMSMTGQLKSLFDHLAYLYMAHRPEASMFNKQALALSTAAGAGMGKTAKSIAGHLFWWGAARIYQYGVKVYAPDFNSIPVKRKKKIERKVKRIAGKIKKNKHRVKAGFKTRFMFRVMRLGILKEAEWNPADREYWKEQGWLGKKRPYK